MSSSWTQGVSLLYLAKKKKQLPELNIPSPASASPPPPGETLRQTRSAAAAPSGSGNRVTLMERQQSLRVVRRWGKWDVDEAGRFRLYATEDTPWHHTGEPRSLLIHTPSSRSDTLAHPSFLEFTQLIALAHTHQHVSSYLRIINMSLGARCTILFTAGCLIARV
jgi:hypothetical protein